MDKIFCKILEDGTISIRTEGISGENHMSADEFLNDLENFMGSKRQTIEQPKKHSKWGNHNHSKNEAKAKN